MLFSSGDTHVGRKRKLNEDFFYRDDALGLYIVADGVGGESRGEEASKEGTYSLVDWVLRHKTLIEDYKRSPNPLKLKDLSRMMEAGIQSACYYVYQISQQEDTEGKGMATTMTAALFLDELLLVGHVGDSRLYRLRSGRVSQLTEDHSYINFQLKRGMITPEQAAKMSKKRNVITRAVGKYDYVQVDTYDFEVMPGDRYLLCTDGLHGYFRNDQEILNGMTGSLPAIPGRFIELANMRGGKDNITVVVVEVF